MASLIIYEEADVQDTIFETYELTDTSVLIGSAPDNHLVLDTPDIDPSHASLELRDRQWVIQDLGGPGGTAVNGEIIEGPFTLYHGDIIELNQVRIRFQDPDRGVTKEFPQEGADTEDVAHAPPLKGRVWFAGMAGITLLLIVVILVLIIAAHLLGIISMTDLLPSWLMG